MQWRNVPVATEVDSSLCSSAYESDDDHIMSTAGAPSQSDHFRTAWLVCGQFQDMLSLGEVAVLLAVGSWAFGPKELPKVGRALGRLTGQATGYLYKARAQLFNFAEKTELTKVQQEVQATMYQLQAIRSELQGGINILDPGPITRRALRTHSPASSPTAGSSSVPDSIGGTLSTPLGTSFAATAVPKREQIPAAPHAPRPAGFPRDQKQQQDGRIDQLLSSMQGRNDPPSSSLEGNSRHQQQGQQQYLEDQDRSSYPFQVLPVSAVDAGLAPNRTTGSPTGSEILADALQEERISHQALEFFKQHTVSAAAPDGGSSNGRSSDGGNTPIGPIGGGSTSQ